MPKPKARVFLHTDTPSRDVTRLFGREIEMRVYPTSTFSDEAIECTVFLHPAGKPVVVVRLIGTDGGIKRRLRLWVDELPEVGS